MHSFVMRLARIMAMIGGAVLTLLIFLTCISIVGRLLNGVFHGDTMEALAPQFSAWMAARVGRADLSRRRVLPSAVVGLIASTSSTGSGHVLVT